MAVYITLSIVAYTDYPRSDSNPSLTDLEREGQGVWRRANCQACHQIYGFGGFLGPDLTNRVTDQTPDKEFQAILESGTDVMPAFQLPPAEQAQVLAFLRAVDRTGRSQPTPLGARRRVNPTQHFERLADAWLESHGPSWAPEARRGLDAWSAYGCGSCHVPFTVGLMRAPDLSRRAIDISVPALSEIVNRGRRNMPRFSLTPEQLADLHAFLQWVRSNRTQLVEMNDRLLEREDFSWRALPWFEYR